MTSNAGARSHGLLPLGASLREAAARPSQSEAVAERSASQSEAVAEARPSQTLTRVAARRRARPPQRRGRRRSPVASLQQACSKLAASFSKLQQLLRLRRRSRILRRRAVAVKVANLRRRSVADPEFCVAEPSR